MGVVFGRKKLDPEVRGQMLSCQAQMNKFDFLFRIHLGTKLYIYTLNLSKALEASKMSVISANVLLA